MKRLGAGNASLVAVVAIGLLGLLGIGALFSVVAQNLAAKRVAPVDVRADDPLEESVRRFLESKPGGKRPDFPDTAVGKLQELAYEFLEKQVARQKAFDEKFAEIGFDWVMTAESLRTKENLDECRRRIGEAKKLGNWFYTTQNEDFVAMRKAMGEAAQGDSKAEAALAKFDADLAGASGARSLNEKVRTQLEKNHEALLACVDFLAARHGKYDVKPDGSIQFKKEVSKADAEEYNRRVARTVSTLAEINRLEGLRTAKLNQALPSLGR